MEVFKIWLWNMMGIIPVIMLIWFIFGDRKKPKNNKRKKRRKRKKH